MVVIALLTAACVAAVSWILPLAAIHAGGARWLGFVAGVDPAAAPSEHRWGDSDEDGSRGWAVPRAGEYYRSRHILIDTVDFRRMIFSGELKDQPYYRKDPPPGWAATISIDLREGYEQVVTTATGWPWRCWRSERWISWGPAATPAFSINDPFSASTSARPGERTIGAYEFKHHGGQDGELPLRPIWPALVGDAAVFGAAWSIALLGPAWARREVRRRRGRCVMCGYDLGGHDAGGCPECGWGR